MAELVPHDHAHGAKVEAGGVGEVEERALEDAGRNHDLKRNII